MKKALQQAKDGRRHILGKDLGLLVYVKEIYGNFFGIFSL